MKKEHKQFIENIVEKWNFQIQAAVTFFTLFIGIFLKILGFDEKIDIAIGILLMIFIELILLQAKDSIMQKKVNEIKILTLINKGALIRVLDYGEEAIQFFFSSANQDFFVSGIALNQLIGSQIGKLENLVKNKRKVNILLSSPEAIEMNAILYHGFNDDKEKRQEAQANIAECVSNCISSILRSPVLCEALRTRDLEIRFSNAPFTTSYMGCNIFNENKKTSVIKASFYQYGCTKPCDEPNIVVCKNEDEFWYGNLVAAAKRQWKDGCRAISVSELKEVQGYLTDYMKNMRK